MMKYPQVWTLIMAGSFAIYGIQMGSNMPRYMEIHFHQPTYLANIMAGMIIHYQIFLVTITDFKLNAH